MRKTLLGAFVSGLVLALVLPAGAIVYGEPDGDDHPNVGALIAEWNTPGTKEQLCTGTLIDEDVFLTAAHCTAFLESLGIPNDEVWVSFDEDVDPVTGSTDLIRGTWVTNPAFSHVQSDPGDLAVVLLDEEASATPAHLPELGLLDAMKKAGTLRSQRFTAVGYGVREATKGTGAPVFPYDGTRWRAVSSFNALNAAWLRLSQNQATSNGGSCFGDSGGPNFLGAGAGETDVIAAVTVTGDSMCRATNVTQRLDTRAAQDFIVPFLD